MPNQENLIVSGTTPPLPPEEEARRSEHANRFDGIAIAAGTLALATLFYLIANGIQPFLLVLTILLLLYPLREYRAARLILLTSATLFGLWLVSTLASILLPFIVAMVIAYLFNPLVTTLHRKWKLSRTWLSIIIVLLLVGVVGFAGYLIVPLIVNEAEALLRTLSDFFQNNEIRFDEESIRRFLVSLGIPGKYVTQFLNNELYPALKNFTATLPSIALSIVSALPSVLQRTLDLILIPIASIYLLKDWYKLGPSLLGFVPAKRRPHWSALMDGIDKVLYGYIRGQSIVAIIIGTLSGIALTIAGVPYASLLGVMIMLLDLIPFIGLISSVVIVEIVIVITMPITAGNLIIGAAIILGMHMLETYFLGPRIVGKGVGIPPILILASVFVFAYFLGFLGMLIAVPTTGVIMLFAREYRQAVASGKGIE
ncbi:MAG: AI-2E family transporter [Bacteroidetes bacterium]|nr:AI-2E family transporter [Bacteroidota bacterium]